MKKYDVVIIGAGTAGLTARREVAKKTDNYAVIDDGPMGTTCARVGCMPSKVLIQAANDFHRRGKLAQMGIHGGDQLHINGEEVMAHVRSLRDRFVRGVKGGLPEWEDKLICKRAKFIDPHTLDLGDEKIQADKIIIATGSRPIIPAPWMDYRNQILTTDEFFEMPTIPKSMAVIGLGVIGIELGQGLHRLGCDVTGISKGKGIGGLTDPVIQNYVHDKFSAEMPIYIDGAEFEGRTEDGLLKINTGSKVVTVEKALVSVGRRPNIDGMGLENLGIELDGRGLPAINKNTMKLEQLEHIFLPGDANADRPILHEAADEGVIAGHNSVNEEQCFRRRVPLGITFSDPNVAFVGQNYQQLTKEGVDFVTGEVSFEGQGRSIVKLKEQGLLHIYAEPRTGRLLGCELHAPDGEHLAHLVAWAVSMNMTVFECLKMPFYHPVIEEGLRTALRDAANKASGERQSELIRCNDAPIR